MLNTLLNIIPPKWHPWIIIGALATPYVTRFGYALYARRGLFGAIHGFLFGTNSVKEPNASATVPPKTP
jgi:hypothetical protein